MTTQPLFGLAVQAVSTHPIIAMFLNDHLPEAPKKAARFLKITFPVFYICLPSTPISFDATVVTCTV